MNKTLGPVLILIAALSWSTAGLFTRIVSTDIPTTLFWRSLIGGLCVLIIFLWKENGKITKPIYKFTKGEFIISILSTAGMICFISAFFFTTIANVSFMYGIMPVITLLLSVIFLKEKISKLSIFCCGVSFVGVVIMTYGNSNLSDFIGLLLAFGMTFFMASLTVAAKFFPNADSIKSTYLSAFMGAIIVLPFATFSNIGTSDYYWLGIYGIVNVGLGFGVYLLGVTRTTALTASLIGLLEIPMAPIWAWLLFGEKTSVFVVVGGLLIISSTMIYLIISNQRSKI